MMRKGFSLLLVTAGLTAGCFDDGPVPTTSGTYLLRTVNGMSLPYTSTSGSTTTVIVDETFVLAKALTYSDAVHTRTTSNGQTTDATVTETGTYSILGNSISFLNSSATRVRVASGDATILTITDATGTYVYAK